MSLSRRWPWPLVVPLAAALSSAALGQPAADTNYTTVKAAPGKPVRLGYYADAHKNCTPAPLPEIRVIQPPKAGILLVRRAQLVTSKVPGCPRMQTPAQVVFYRARPGSGGTDHVVYQVTGPSGRSAAYDVTIEITAAPPPAPFAPPSAPRPLKPAEGQKI